MKKTLSLLCILAMIMTITFPSLCSIGMKNGITLCLYTIIPSFFPFLIITNILIKYDLFRYISTCTYPLFKKIFGASPNGSFIILTGFTCGYPIGAKTAKEIYKSGKISYSEYLYLIKFCNNPSLPFVINFVYYSILNSNYQLSKLLICIYISSIITGILFNILQRNNFENVTVTETAYKNISHNVFISTFYTLMNLSSYIMIFSIIITYIQKALIKDNIYKATLLLLTEVTSGLDYLSKLGGASKHIPLIIIALISGGLCITAQTLSYLETKSEYKAYFTGKSITIIISIILYIIL